MILHVYRYLASHARLWVKTALLLLLFGGRAFAQTEERVPFANSVGPLPAQAAATMRTLAATQKSAVSMEFGIALQMRNFPLMQERVARGETISRDELERVYLPLQSDCDALAQWLKEQGFTVTLQDASRLGVYARGTVAQIQSSLQTDMVGVTVNGVDFSAARTAPSLPARIAAPVLGINGLQPFRQRNKRAIRRPLTANKPPFLINEILTAFNAKNLGVTGAGQTVAILIDTPPKNTDLTKFWSDNSIAQSTANVSTINVNNKTLPAASGEESLDVEWSSGIAPGAKIRVYASATLEDTDLDKCFQRIITDLKTDATIHQLSISLGLGETYSTSSQLNTDNQLLTTIASQGVSTFVSSGDGGSTPDDQGESAGPLQVEYYSSDPSVTAVGGTALTVNSSTGARTGETAWSGSGGGVSVQFNRPSWQTGTSVPAGTKRLVPDVSLPADPNTGAYVVLNGTVYQYGGTSWSAPTWAGFCALMNEARAKQSKAALGLLNPSVYPLLGTSNFYDITSGSNALSATAAGKYSAAAGYDLVTGIGSPNVGMLLNTLAGQTTAAPTVSGFTPASGAVGSSVIITGTNFTSVTAVLFNGVGASFAVNSPTQITATVPSGATTGTISVTTPGGTASSAAVFTVSGGAATGAVVISQIYGSGGNTGAIYKNDFIELFNPGTGAVDLSGYSIQYASASGTSWTSKTNLTGFIQPQRYYLVQGAAGSAGRGSALPTPDATGTIDLSGTNGKVALVNNQTTIASGTSNPIGAAYGVVDFVGFGTANAFEGSGAAPAPSATTADVRANGGLTDTNDNASDFAAAAPSPRNSASPPNSGGLPGTPDLTIAKTHSGSFTQADAGDTYTITVSNIGAGPTNGAVTVTDALPAGLTAAAFSGAGWTVNLGALTATRSDSLAANSAYPPLTLTVDVSASAPASVTNAASVSGGGESNTANDSASDPTTIIALTPSQSWRYQYFGTTANSGAAADAAVAAGDGLPNLLKYALGLNPLVPAVNPARADVSTGYLRLTAPKNPNATDVLFGVEVTGNLLNAAAWNANGATVDQNTSTLLQAHDNTPVSAAAPGRFIRLRVTRP